MSDAASAQAQQQSAATTHRADGKVENITKDEITISHGAVASLQWGPMTMGFKLPPTGLPPGIEVGRNVTFEFAKNKEAVFAIQSIAPTGSAAPSSPDKSAGRISAPTPNTTPSQGAKQ